MFARFGTLLTIVISAVLVFSGTADAAINVDSVGPESSYDNYIFTGSTQYSRAEFNEPFGTVYWYVRGPGETGLGTLVYTDYGDGTSESSQFSHTFSQGSTSGEEYEITSYAYPVSDADDQTVDWDSYTLTVWTPPEEVITFTNTITDDIKIGDSYSFNVEATSSSSNYVINEIEVLVNGVSAVKRSVSRVTSTSINVTGSLGWSAGDAMNVEVRVSGLVTWIGKGIIIIGAKQVWRALLTTTLFGNCKCATDGDALDNRENLIFWCWVEEEGESGSEPEGEWVSDTRSNTTIVEYQVLKISNIFAKKTDKVKTNNSGFYIFDNQIPIGYFMHVTLKADDMHYHGDDPIPANRPLRVCYYEATERFVDTGNVAFEVVPVNYWDSIQVDFNADSSEDFDPCEDGPYPKPDFWNQ